MACTITSPTIVDCNDLSGGIKKLELSQWSADFNAVSATWVEMVLAPNSSDWEEASTTDPKTKVTTYAQTLNFMAQGIASVSDWGNLTQWIVVAKVTDYQGNIKLLGVDMGLSNNGSRMFESREFEGGQGYEASFTGVSPSSAATGVATT